MKFEYQKVIVNSKSHTNKTFDFNSNLKFDNCKNVNFNFLKFEYQKGIVNSKSHTNKTFDFNSNLNYEEFDIGCRNANFCCLKV